MLVDGEISDGEDAVMKKGVKNKMKLKNVMMVLATGFQVGP